MKPIYSLVIAAALLGSVATTALAQYRGLDIYPDAGPVLGGPPDADYVYGGMAVDALPTPFSHGGSCVKACENDFQPCDPEYWKRADRRCNWNQRR